MNRSPPRSVLKVWDPGGPASRRPEEARGEDDVDPQGRSGPGSARAGRLWFHQLRRGVRGGDQLLVLGPGGGRPPGEGQQPPPPRGGRQRRGAPPPPSPRRPPGPP